MKEQHDIEKIFREKLQNLEADPGANAWSNIQSNLGSVASSTATTSAAGASSWAATVIVGVVISAVAIGGYFFFNQEGEKKKQGIQAIDEAPKVEQVLEKKENKKVVATEATSSEDDKIQGIEIANEKEDISIPKEADQSSSTVKADINQQEVAQKSIHTEDSDVEEQEEGSSNKVSITANPIDNQVEGEISNNVDNNSAAISEKQQDQTNSSKANPITPLDSNKHIDKIANSEEKEVVEPKLVFPNVFSPNQDGWNDYFEIDLEASDEVNFIDVRVLTNTGKEIFIFREVTDKWDGNLPSGSAAPTGTYQYIGTYTKDGKTYPSKGLFSLTR